MMRELMTQFSSCCPLLQRKITLLVPGEILMRTSPYRRTSFRAEFLIPTTVTKAPNEALGANAPSDDYLEPEPEDEQPITRPDDRPVTSPRPDWTISALRDKLDRGLLNLQPKFQREYVWALRPELPSRLIKSVLLGIPIPPIYFGKDTEGRLEMIDGQQRLTTLVDFVTNKFQLRKLNRMASLNGKLFKDLPQPQQEKILIRQFVTSLSMQPRTLIFGMRSSNASTVALWF